MVISCNVLHISESNWNLPSLVICIPKENRKIRPDNVVHCLNKSTHTFPRGLNTTTVSLSDFFVVLKHTIVAKESPVILVTMNLLHTQGNLRPLYYLERIMLTEFDFHLKAASKYASVKPDNISIFKKLKKAGYVCIILTIYGVRATIVAVEKQ
jgi:hypothetical protein